jgi:hypothetical protein
MKQIIKKLLGIEKLESAKAQALLETEAATKAAEEAKAAEELAKITPKERANKKGEPWVSVLDTHVNKDNIRNGFFELDWNDHFVLQLKQEGYGFDGDPDEEIVDRWFRDIVRNMLADEGQDVTRGVGYINVKPLTPGKSEVS